MKNKIKEGVMLQLLLCQKEFKYFSSEIPVIIIIIIIVVVVVVVISVIKSLAHWAKILQEKSFQFTKLCKIPNSFQQVV